ncbi:hypothetical protein Mgra_00003292 [Meloidogyne graminicola]|uniref:Uncharacterized protein n=1 Tax=Meloidogyne graminicola TaxID=189291 RepID=A0A8S9ZW06_9BILA|nr:hypothetical protein Mgra_00003292 [Meloidogyne graminicola]
MLTFRLIYHFGISDSNIERKSLNRIRRGIFCNSACSCGWGNCYPSTGYTASNCCSPVEKIKKSLVKRLERNSSLFL